MSKRQELVRELAALDDIDWFSVLSEARDQRKDKSEQQATYEEPRPGISRDQFAQWIAYRHYSSDPGIQEVIYLPSGAPEHEIRFIEVNALLTTPQVGRVESVDFSPTIDGLNFRVLVADVTPDEWQRIQDKKLLLPEGWDLKDCRKLGRIKKV